MKTRTITSEEALEFCKKEESHFFDRKAKELSGKKIQKIAVAFANADGGDFVIGIKDDKDESAPRKRWSGYPTKEDFNHVFQNLSLINPSIPYTATFLYNEELNEYAL
ncbi:MAG: ATP-binding protein, partial [Saprospiraceae bacterium]|nr:ATP-binding protein [Saprospiraceae bacterium]